eukprot:3782778-Prymnesium_polylepis.1
MVRHVAVAGATRALCAASGIGLAVCGLWPMAYWCAVRRYRAQRALCGAKGSLWPMVRHKAVLERYAAL